MSTIQNLQTYNPFADTGDDLVEKQSSASQAIIQQHIHIRVQKRNGRKSVTTIQGLNPKFDFKRILKALKKEFHCNGSLEEDPDLGQIIQLSGDQRQSVSKFLIDEGITDAKNLKIHGF